MKLSTRTRYGVRLMLDLAVNRKKGQIFADMVYDVTVAALEDAGLTIHDIDSVVTCSNDFLLRMMMRGRTTGGAW